MARDRESAPRAGRPIEELRAAIESAATPRERYAALTTLYSRVRRSEPRDALRLARQSLRIARAEKDPSMICASLTYCAVGHHHLREHAKSRATLAEAIAVAEAGGVDDSVLAELHHSIGGLHLFAERYVEAAGEMIIALEHAELASHRFRIANICNSLAAVHFAVGDYSVGLGYLERAMIGFEELEDPSDLSLALTNLALVSGRLGDHAGAIEAAERAEQIALGANRLRVVAQARLMRAESLIALGRVDEAIEGVEATIEAGFPLGAGDILADLYHLLAQAYEARGDFQRALEMFSRTRDACEAGGLPHRSNDTIAWARARIHAGIIDTAREDLEAALVEVRSGGDREGELEALEVLALYHETVGNSVDALRFHKEHTALRDAITGAQQQRELVQLALQRELSDARRERERLREESAQLRAEMQAKDRELASMALRLVERTQLLGEIGERIADVSTKVDDTARASVRSLARRVQAGVDRGAEWRSFEEQFTRVHPEFRRQLLERCPKLSRAELRVCALLRVGLATKEIGEILSSSERTVEWHRSNLRAKLGLGKDASLATFLTAL
jgi:DNA-binding CsgD family transcriptional regulator